MTADILQLYYVAFNINYSCMQIHKIANVEQISNM